jgi:hypothetical protein
MVKAFLKSGILTELGNREDTYTGTSAEGGMALGCLPGALPPLCCHDYRMRWQPI